MKRYIYLISPQKIRGVKFYRELNNVLKTNKVKYFQLRLKKISTTNLIKISRKVKAKKNYNNDFKNILKCTNFATSLGLEVHAGHGIDYKTAKVLSKIKYIKEFNIGHFIIGESLFHGLKNIVKTFRKICR